MRKQIFDEKDISGKTIEYINNFGYNCHYTIMLFNDNTFAVFDSGEFVDNDLWYEEMIDDYDIKQEDMGIFSEEELGYIKHPEKAIELIEELRIEINFLREKNNSLPNNIYFCELK